MRHILFTPDEQESYEVAILIKPTYFNSKALTEHYVAPLAARGIPESKIIAFDLAYKNNKASATMIKEYLNELLPTLKELGVRFIYCADAAYFKVLAKQTKADSNFGYMFNVAVKDYEHIQVTYGLNHGSLIYNPEQYDKLDMSIQTLIDAYTGSYNVLGADIIHYEDYPESLSQIKWTLNRISQYPILAVDIEAFSLDVNHAGIGSIGFAWSKHEGCAFLVDYVPHSEGQMSDMTYGFRQDNEKVRALLRRFFESYRGKIMFHNATYDTKVLIRYLWMKDPLDRQGMLHGLHTMYRCLDDTKVIAYLATNSTAGNVLGLKELAQPFAGNWAQSEINDIRKIHRDDLLRYNLVDCLSTFYVYERYLPRMIADKQEDIYRNLMLPTLKVLTQIEIVGMPLNTDMVKEAKRQLNEEEDKALAIIESSGFVQEATRLIQIKEMNKENAKLKTKVKPIEDFAHIKFNPNSGAHLAVLFHEVMELPILERTKTKQPATGGDVIEKLLHHATEEQQDVLQALIDLGSVTKILTAFLPAFEKATPKADGRAYLHGGFNLGGTISGRLSSSKPNLQNLPSGSKWGKLIKMCFSAAYGELFVSADFNALEDRINTLLTKDPNKIKVYTEGYDGHCFRAFYYWGDQMPDIVDTVESVNSIKEKYPKLRSKSKSPSFALQYAGTWITLVKNCGFSESEAKRVEANYHKMYEVSDQWMAERIQECCEKGYATVAFGLRIRTPLLKQTVLGTHKTPKEAEAEARSVGNALSGQSYGLLNNRAVVEFMERVWNSPYRYDIVPVALIHDAIYLICTEDAEVVAWVNKNLTECMAWNELPEIQHETIKLSAELDIHYPNWANAITLPNDASVEQVKEICNEWYQEHMAQAA
ncbi:TPA: DNA polymerase I [Acinetobacter baumannii]|nr:DNA polymerase I [Acinetobacter baumannii]HCW3892823.1 DNA polymerase I [Acinetobacter baumannii]